jgi:hypothetical protein
MRRIFIVVLFVLVASVAHANPVGVDAGSVSAFPIVAVFALLVEAGVVALLLSRSGVESPQVFVGYFVMNLVVFISLFVSFTPYHMTHILGFESLSVAADSICIKWLTAIETFRGDDSQGVSWLQALLISCAGNVTSFLVGLSAQLLVRVFWLFLV